MANETIKAIMILEILGRPKETIDGALKAIVEKLSKENGVKLTNSTYHDVMPVENSKDLFTTFVELDLEFESIEVLYFILFAYMPSHIEISNPEKIDLTNNRLTQFTNKLLQKLHDYDAVVKHSLAEKDFLTKKLFEVAPHLFKVNPNTHEKLESKPQENKTAKKTKKKSKKNKN